MAQAFTILPTNNKPRFSVLGATVDTEGLPTIESMRVKEMQAELKERNISYADCFDKESLAKRLGEARDGIVKPPEPVEPVAVEAVQEEEEPKSSPEPPTPSSKKPFDKEEKLTELRAMKVRQLREECAKRRIRWAQFVEKEELVQALIQAIEQTADFSVSGAMQPGQVTELTGEQLDLELSQPSDAPLLLDSK